MGALWEFEGPAAEGEKRLVYGTRIFSPTNGDDFKEERTV